MATARCAQQILPRAVANDERHDAEIIITFP